VLAVIPVLPGCALQVRAWSDDAAAAGMLLSQTMYANRPNVHVVHVAAEMVPIAKVRADSSCNAF
jgi:hypothetical protein